MASVLCADCIGGTSPYDPSKWGYVPMVPNGYVAGDYIPQCATSGDLNLGIVQNQCGAAPTPPLSRAQVPYLLYSKDCIDGNFCLGKDFNFLNCAAPTDENSYGSCLDGHYWYVRDWGTELATQASQVGCSILDPSTPDRTATCPPSLWYGSYKSSIVMAQECVGAVSSPPTSYAGLPTSYSSQMWNTPSVPGSCDQYMGWLVKSGDQILERNAQNLFVAAISDWAYQLTNPSSGGPPIPVDPADPFVQTILDYTTPGGKGGGMYAQLALAAAPYVRQACQLISKDQIVGDQSGVLGKLCACYLPPSQYYLPGIIPVECDALCAYVGSSGTGLGTWETSTSGLPILKACQQTSCVIDDFAASYINTNGGDISFNQICGSCGVGAGSGGCTCIIGGVNINAQNSTIGGVNLTQECGSFASPFGAGNLPQVASGGLSFYERYRGLIWTIVIAALVALLAWAVIRVV